jgi:myo-inositol 2-dehydrogenase / D-chiro-inositol 1-dehydrogenase
MLIRVPAKEVKTSPCNNCHLIIFSIYCQIIFLSQTGKHANMKPKSKPQSRREFIGGAAALSLFGAIGAAHVLSSCSRKEKYQTPLLHDSAPDGPILKAGLIGCGGRGTGAAINFLNAGPNLQITALGDVFPGRVDNCRSALKTQRGVDIPDQNCFSGFDAYKHVIDSDVDVIICASPPHFRPKHFELAVQARKHTFIEKPCGVDPVGVRSIMASGKMAEAAGLTVVSGTQMRHARDYIATFGMIKNGAIGDLISGNAIRLGGKLWHTNRQPGWSDMEAMLRDWVNWCWLSGDHIVEMFIHQLDILNWFFEKFPAKAVGMGGRHRRPTGDQYDFISVDYEFDDGRKYQGMHRQIDGCYNNSTITIYGTKGYTNCQNQIFDYNHNLIWEYDYPLDEEGHSSNRLAITREDQSHINLVTAIRINKPVNESLAMASSTMTAIMGRESAYTGNLVTWDEMMNSGMRLGPEIYAMGPVDIRPVPPVPGIAGA